MSEQTLTADGWTGYTPEDLDWFAREYADTEWAVHVVGADDVHTHANPDLPDDDPGNPALTGVSARKLARQANRIGREHAHGGLPVMHATVLHHGVPVRDDPPFTPVTRTDLHFSPGFEGEVPNHIGIAADCAFTECRLAQARHEAAADIQDVTATLFDAEVPDSAQALGGES